MSDVPSVIGPYEISRELGRGGMGVVYLARDTRLDRDVAIKALPAELAADPARLDRFEREARLLAGLSHPNIAGIYGVEERDGAKYLVLEYVEGQTLADRLDRGPLPLDEALEVAVQIAAGVEAAHEAGVIHRDLKPGNIILTPEGKATVLDFGLARSDDGSLSSSGAAEDPTRTTPQHSPTIEGAILGTAAYMSPEQARGRRVDKRTDLWSFGVVLYEMLIGSTPFLGETASDTIGAVLHKEFTLDGLPAGTPRMVRHVLARCLDRDRTRRLQSVGDARVELADAIKQLESGESETADRGASSTMRWVWPAIAALMASTAVVSLGLWAISGPGGATGSTGPVVVDVRRVTDLAGNEYNAALSADGKTVLYMAWHEGGPDIWRLRIGGESPVNITNTPSAKERCPAFSPDGESIAYHSDAAGGGIFVMGATGENPRRIAGVGADPAWSPDGRSIVYSTAGVLTPYQRGVAGALHVVDLETGESRGLDTADPSWDSSHPFHSDAVSPAWSPDGGRIAYWASRGGQRDIFTVSAEGGNLVRITSDVHTDWNPMWAADSASILFLSDREGRSGIWSVALDASGRPAGDPRPVMPGPAFISQAAIAADGRTLLIDSTRTRHLVERVGFDRTRERLVGRSELVHRASGHIGQLSVSRDGEWIAYQSAPPDEDITIVRTDGTERRRLTQGLFKDRGPQWAPDGQTLTYYSNRNGDYELWEVSRSSAETRRIPIRGTGTVHGPIFSPDRTRLVAAGAMDGEAGGLGLFEIGPDGSFELERRLEEGFGGGIRWSPDGRRLIGRTETRLMVYDLSTDSLIPIRTPDGERVAPHLGAVWLDASLMVAWKGGSRQVFVFDVDSGESRWVDTIDEPQVKLHALIDGDTLYYSYRETDSDLWLVTLE